MKRWKLYFAYSHLPPHLQAVSKPFHDLAEIVANSIGRYEPEAFTEAVRDLDRISPTDRVEADLALYKLSRAAGIQLDYAPGRRNALRFILEAKDCAVRAMIPDPPDPDAG